MERHFLLCAVIQICHFFSGRYLSIQSLWISLYEFYLHLTTWKTGMAYSYIWICNLSLGIFWVQLNSSIIYFSQSSAEHDDIFRIFQESICMCIKMKIFSWQLQKTAYERNAISRMKMKSSKQTAISVPISSQPSLFVSEGAYALRGNFSSSSARTLITL